ncbi:MAG: hypothetical protein M0Z49_00980 [Chloroflexi bacterium]|nr:hypothetical protein [Chloroflexota bacterium]
MTDELVKRYAPYLAWRTFFNVILQLDEKGLPTRIDRSFLKQRSGLDQGYLIATLKAFKMIADDGTVLDPLKDLVAARDGRQPLVGQLLRAHYPEVFALPLNATQAELDDVFREVYAQSGATLRKAQTFLLHGASFAGLKLSPYFKTPRGVQGATSPRRTRKRATPRSSTAAATPIVADTSVPPRPEVPADDMRLRYFDVLLKKVDSTGETDADLLDRIERLIGLDRSTARTAPSRRTRVETTGEAAADEHSTEA